MLRFLDLHDGLVDLQLSAGLVYRRLRYKQVRINSISEEQEEIGDISVGQGVAEVGGIVELSLSGRVRVGGGVQRRIPLIMEQQGYRQQYVYVVGVGYSLGRS
jgi:hypothetical protein